MDPSLERALDEAAEALNSVTDPSGAPSQCLLKKASWSSLGDGCMASHCELEVPDPRDVARIHGMDMSSLARETGFAPDEDMWPLVASIHASGAESSLRAWLSNRVREADTLLSNQPFEAPDGSLFKLSPNPDVGSPALDDDDGEARVLAYKLEMRVDPLPAGAYERAESTCDERFPGWRSFAEVDFEPGVDERGPYLDGSVAISGRAWNVWVAEYPEGIDAGLVMGPKGSSTTFAKRQGFTSFAQCANWVSSVIEGVRAGAYDARIARTESKGA